jgi:hypothetical protein
MGLVLATGLPAAAATQDRVNGRVPAGTP